MKKSIRYKCLIDLRKIRKLKGKTQEELASELYCSSRVVQRIEDENATSNYSIAKKLAEIYSFDYKEQFIKCKYEKYYYKNKKYIREIYKNLYNNTLDTDATYYYLYYKKLPEFGSQIWGKTYWIDSISYNIEIRKVLEINTTKFLENHKEKVPIINTDDDFVSFIFGLETGRVQDFLISKECADKNLADCMEKHIVDIDKMFFWHGVSDNIFLGKYKPINIGNKITASPHSY